LFVLYSRGNLCLWALVNTAISKLLSRVVTGFIVFNKGDEMPSTDGICPTIARRRVAKWRKMLAHASLAQRLELILRLNAPAHQPRAPE